MMYSKINDKLSIPDTERTLVQMSPFRPGITVPKTIAGFPALLPSSPLAVLVRNNDCTTLFAPVTVAGIIFARNLN